MEIAPFLFILVVWVFMGLLVPALVKSAKKSTGKKQPPSRNASPKPEGEQLSMDFPDSPSAAGTAVSAEAPLSPMRPTLRPMQHDDSLYAGSLNAVTGEGVDPCHEEQLSSLDLAEAVPAAHPSPAPGLRLSWSSDEVVRGFVMSEILNRKRS